MSEKIRVVVDGKSRCVYLGDKLIPNVTKIKIHDITATNKTRVDLEMTNIALDIEAEKVQAKVIEMGDTA